MFYLVEHRPLSAQIHADPRIIASNGSRLTVLQLCANVVWQLRTDQSAGIVVVENAKCYGRKNTREIQEERSRYCLVQRVVTDEPCACTQVG